MRTGLRSLLTLLLAFTLLCGLAYPAVMTGFARLAFPEEARGSFVVRDGRRVGSALVGQAFTRPENFWSRPSATSPRPYDASASSGSNLGPTNPDLVKVVKERIAALRAADPGNRRPVPIDLVTASGSGLDPEISPEAAEYQVPRVARARGLDEAQVRALVRARTARRLPGLGPARVNVLLLNLDLKSAGGGAGEVIASAAAARG